MPKYIVYSVLFVLMISFKISSPALLLSKPVIKEIATQGGNDIENDAEQSFVFENMGVLRLSLINIPTTPLAIIPHNTIYKNTYVPLHFQVINLQPPEQITTAKL